MIKKIFSPLLRSIRNLNAHVRIRILKMFNKCFKSYPAYSWHLWITGTYMKELPGPSWQLYTIHYSPQRRCIIDPMIIKPARSSLRFTLFDRGIQHLLPHTRMNCQRKQIKEKYRYCQWRRFVQGRTIAFIYRS